MSITCDGWRSLSTFSMQKFSTNKYVATGTWFTSNRNLGKQKTEHFRLWQNSSLMKEKNPVTHVLSSEIPLQIQSALHTWLYYYTIGFQCSKNRLCCESPTNPSLYGDTTNQARNVRLLWPPHATNTRVWGKVGPLKQEWIRTEK